MRSPGLLASMPGCAAVSVSYDGSEYVATYIFNLTNALVGPGPVTYRYLTCLYDDPATGIAKRAGASVDVVRGLGWRQQGLGELQPVPNGRGQHASWAEVQEGLGWVWMAASGKPPCRCWAGGVHLH